MAQQIEFALSFSGNTSDDSIIDFYDVSQALIGFQRTLALTTHLVLNGTVITQAPSLKGARIIAAPPEEGSWKVVAGVIGAIWAAGQAPQDSAVGHLLISGYDYVVSETLGFHVDFDSTLGQQYKYLNENKSGVPKLEQSKFDAVIEKCEVAVRDMHRPIIGSETATKATILVGGGGQSRPLNHPLTRSTFEYVSQTHQENYPDVLEGRVSSYNGNTYKGRVFVREVGRPVPFTLRDAARTPNSIGLVTSSLSTYTRFLSNSRVSGGFIQFVAFKNTSRSGQLKSLTIVEINALSD